MTRVLCRGKIHFRLIITLCGLVRIGPEVIRCPVISIINVPSEVLAFNRVRSNSVLRPRVASFPSHDPEEGL